MPLKDHTGRMNPIEKLLRVSRIGMITNQSAFGSDGEYHFQSIHKLYDLKKIFLPEHGLFAELQDQVSGSSLRYDLDEVEFVNLYGDQESSLAPDSVSLDGLDVVIIDIRDTGARYYTFLTTAYYFLEEIHKWNSSGKNEISAVVFDSPNPAGKKTEGSPLQKEFESFVGVRSVLHRHGLTPGRLLSYYQKEFSLNVKIRIVNEGWYEKKIPNFFGFHLLRIFRFSPLVMFIRGNVFWKAPIFPKEEEPRDLLKRSELPISTNGKIVSEKLWRNPKEEAWF